MVCRHGWNPCAIARLYVPGGRRRAGERLPQDCGLISHSSSSSECPEPGPGPEVARTGQR